MKHISIPSLLKVALITGALIFNSNSFGFAQDRGPSSSPSPPAANTPQADEPGNATVPPPPASGNNYSDEDFDFSNEPLGRGCPFRDDNLELIT